MTDRIIEILRALGVGAHYRGYRQTVTALSLALEDENRLTAVVKEVYIPAAKASGCSWSSVERNMRTVVARAWRVNRNLLTEIAGYDLSQPPTASEFLDILANYLHRHSAQ